MNKKLPRHCDIKRAAKSFCKLSRTYGKHADELLADVMHLDVAVRDELTKLESMRAAGAEAAVIQAQHDRLLALDACRDRARIARGKAREKLRDLSMQAARLNAHARAAWRRERQRPATRRTPNTISRARSSHRRVVRVVATSSAKSTADPDPEPDSSRTVVRLIPKAGAL